MSDSHLYEGSVGIISYLVRNADGHYNEIPNVLVHASQVILEAAWVFCWDAVYCPSVK